MSHYSELEFADLMARRSKVKAAKSTVPTVGLVHERHVRARGQAPRHRPGIMNKTEAEYAGMLDARKLAGEVIDYWFEEVTFKLADDCRYTPDFMILHTDLSISFIETKGGFIREDSTIKLKMAAQRYPFKFVFAQKQSKKDGGGWLVKEM